MVRRGEWEKKYWKKKLENAVAWDKEKTASDDQKSEKDKQHRKTIETSREEDRQSLKLKKVSKVNSRYFKQ